MFEPNKSLDIFTANLGFGRRTVPGWQERTTRAGDNNAQQPRPNAKSPRAPAFSNGALAAIAKVFRSFNSHHCVDLTGMPAAFEFSQPSCETSRPSAHRHRPHPAEALFGDRSGEHRIAAIAADQDCA
jgi:hypothetical protein